MQGLVKKPTREQIVLDIHFYFLVVSYLPLLNVEITPTNMKSNSLNCSHRNCDYPRDNTV